MNTRFVSIITLIFIVSLTLFTRFSSLLSLPPALFSDEVDAGYQAMVFNANGTDYYGNKLPIHFHSFSDWRTSAYIYSISLVQKITNNPELSIRLPSAIFSSISVLIFYLITKSTLATFIFALSPWAIHFGRSGFEVSGMLLAILLGLYSFLQYLNNKNSRFLFISSFYFCLSPYFYSTAKLFLPITLLTILFVWYQEIKKINSKTIALVIISALIFLSPLIVDTIKGNSGYRFNYISIFTEPHREQVTNQLRYEDIYTNNIGVVGVSTPKSSFAFHNKYELIAEKFIQNYYSSFSTDFLFLKGDSNLRQGFGGHGMLYLIDLFFVLSGLIIYFKNKTKLGTYFLLSLILAPIAFSLTRDSISAHSTRLILMLPSLVYFASLNTKHKYITYLLYFVSFISFWHYYNLHYPQISSPYWHTNIKEAIVASVKSPSPKIYYSNKYEPFLPFFLFYKQYLPDKNKSITDKLITVDSNFFSGNSLENKYYFGNIDWNKLTDTPGIFVIPKSEYQNIENKLLFIIVDIIPKKYINSEEFYILKTNSNVIKNK